MFHIRFFENFISMIRWLFAFGIQQNREAGENPVRYRRCNRGILPRGHWETGKAGRVMMLEPEDLPEWLSTWILYVMGCCGKHR